MCIENTSRSSLTREECSMHRHDSLSLWHRYDIARTSLWPRYDPQRGSGFRGAFQRFWKTFWWERMKIKGRPLLHPQDLLNYQISHQFAFRRLLFISLFQFIDVCNVFATCLHENQKDYISRDCNSSNIVVIDFSNSRQSISIDVEFLHRVYLYVELFHRVYLFRVHFFLKSNESSHDRSRDWEDDATSDEKEDETNRSAEETTL